MRGNSRWIFLCWKQLVESFSRRSLISGNLEKKFCLCQRVGWGVSVYLLIILCLILLVWIPTDRWEYFIRKYCKVLLHWEYTTTYYCQHFQILSIQKDKNFKSSDLYMKSGDPWKSFRWNIKDYNFSLPPPQVTEEEQWNHYNEFVFLRKSDYPCNFRPVAASSQLEYF